MKQLLRFSAVKIGSGDGLRAAITEQQAAAGRKFISFGMPAKVIVIIENQDARFGAGTLAVKISGGESADASADHDQIVVISVRRRGDPGLAVAHGVRHFP